MDEIREKLDQVIGNNYGSFKPIIIEILILAYTRFDYSEQEIIGQAKNLLTHLDHISFENQEKNTLGWARHGNLYSKDGGQISLHNKYKDASNIKGFIMAIAHELFHSKSYRRRYNFSLRKYNLFSRRKYSKIFTETTIKAKYGSLIMETYNELGTSMTLFGGRTMDDWYCKKTFGYSEFTFFPSLMSGALGYTDYELVKEATTSLSRYDKKVLTKFKDSSKKSVNTILTRLQINMDWIKKLENEQSDKEEIANSYKIIKLKRKTVLSSIFKDILQLASTQVKDDARPIDEDYALELQIREIKMRKTMRDAISSRDFSNYDIYFSFEKVIWNSTFLSQVRDIGILSRFRNVFSNEDFNKYSKLAKEGNLSSLKDELLKKYGINYITEYSYFDPYNLPEGYEKCNYWNKIYVQDCQEERKKPPEHLINYIEEKIIKPQNEHDSLIEQKQQTLDAELQKIAEVQSNKQDEKKEYISSFLLEKLHKPEKARQNTEFIEINRNIKMFFLPNIKAKYLQEYKDSILDEVRVIFKKEKSLINPEKKLFEKMSADLKNLNGGISNVYSKGFFLKFLKDYNELDNFFTQYADAFFKSGILDKDKAKPYIEQYEKTKAFVVDLLTGAYLLSNVKVRLREKRNHKNALYTLASCQNREEIEQILEYYNLKLPEESTNLPQFLLNEIYKPKKKNRFLSLFKKEPKMLPSADTDKKDGVSKKQEYREELRHYVKLEPNSNINNLEDDIEHSKEKGRQ